MDATSPPARTGEQVSLKPLLDKLEPMAMMEDGGVQKALIAMRVLTHKAETDATTGLALASVAGGVKLIMQTALLHPEPALRTGAAGLLALCVGHNDTAFVEACLGQGGASLPAALVRLCHEEDRRAKPDDGGEEPVDVRALKLANATMPRSRAVGQRARPPLTRPATR